MSEETKNYDFKPSVIRKPAELITGKYYATANQYRILQIALARFFNNYTRSSNKNDKCNMEVKLYASELRNLIGDNKNIPRILKETTPTLIDHKIIIDYGDDHIEAFPMVAKAIYDKGETTVQFSQGLYEYLLHTVGRPYTELQLTMFLSLESAYAMRLYELFKLLLGLSKSRGMARFSYNMSELRFMIGLADIDHPKIAELREKMGDHIDWDVLYESLPPDGRKYERWDSFSKYVFNPAIDEICEKTDIMAYTKPLKEGRRYTAIQFDLRYKTPEETDPSYTDDYRSFLKPQDTQRIEFTKPPKEEIVEPDLRSINNNVDTYYDKTSGQTVEYVTKTVHISETADSARKSAKTGSYENTWKRICEKGRIAEFTMYMENREHLAMTVIESLYDTKELIEEYQIWFEQHRN